jgi:hypothetical protein
MKVVPFQIFNSTSLNLHVPHLIINISFTESIWNFYYLKSNIGKIFYYLDLGYQVFQ